MVYDYSEVAIFLSQNANEKNKFKTVSIKCERPSVLLCRNTLLKF